MSLVTGIYSSSYCYYYYYTIWMSLVTGIYYYYYYYYYTVWKSLFPGLFFPVLPLNQRWSPPLTLQASHCSTFRNVCAVPSVAVFCSESIECFPGTASTLSLKLLFTIPVAPAITGLNLLCQYRAQGRRIIVRPKNCWREQLKIWRLNGSNGPILDVYDDDNLIIIIFIINITLACMC